MKLNTRFWLISACILLLGLSVKFSLFSPGSKRKQLPDYMATIKENFDNGLFKKPLKKGHDLYIETLKKWGFNGDLSRRKALSEVKKNQQITGEKTAKSELFIVEHKEAILALCEKHAKDPFAKELKKSLYFTPTKAQQESIDTLAKLKDKFQGDGQSPLENKLIKLDTEYWLKSLALTTQLAKGKWCLADFREQMIVLELERIKQMQIACDETPYPDRTLQHHVDTVADITPQLQARHWANEQVKHLSKQDRQEISSFEQSLLDMS